LKVHCIHLEDYYIETPLYYQCMPILKSLSQKQQRKKYKRKQMSYPRTILKSMYVKLVSVTMTRRRMLSHSPFTFLGSHPCLDLHQRAQSPILDQGVHKLKPEKIMVRSYCSCTNSHLLYVMIITNFTMHLFSSSKQF
jgi:hypothetical protein